MASQRNPYGEELNPTQNVLSNYKPLTAPSLKATSGAMGLNSSGNWPFLNPPQNEPAPPPAPTTLPPAANPASQGASLSSWGYNGPLGMNDYEQQYLNEIARVTGDQSALQALDPAKDYYNKMLSGAYGAEGDSYLQGVLDPMRASAMQNYDELSKALASRYSQVGGYYGGRAGIAQGRLASDTANNMAQQEANLRYQRYADNLGQMGGAASGLMGLSGQMAGLQNNYLGQLAGGGDLLTGRQQYNDQQYQDAIMKSYADWTRARQEQLLPLQMSLGLLNTNAQDNIVTQTPGLLASILGPLGGAAGSFLGMKLAG